jgi:cytochrome c-type biogenesis protein CcmH/NrfG
MAEKPKRLQQVLILVSTIAFVGSTGLGAVSLFTTNPKANIDQANKVAEKSREEQLQVQIRGYESVLKREPENQSALEGLVKLQLQVGNLQAAVAPLENLVKLNPNVESYKLLLAEVKKRSVSTEKPKPK